MTEESAEESTGTIPEPEDGRIEEEAAEAEFARFVDEMGLEVDPDKLEDEDKIELKLNRGRMVRAIMRGSLVIGDNGTPTFTPVRTKNKTPLTFYEPKGADVMTMDQRKAHQNIAQMYAVMAAMTKTGPKRFADMYVQDLNVCSSIAILFLG